VVTAVLQKGGVVGHEKGHLLATAATEHLGQLSGTAGALEELLGSHVAGRGLHVLDVDLLAGRCEVSVPGTSVSIAALAGQGQRLLFAVLVYTEWGKNIPSIGLY